jgi:hypothetical protein
LIGKNVPAEQLGCRLSNQPHEWGFTSSRENRFAALLAPDPEKKQ